MMLHVGEPVIMLASEVNKKTKNLLILRLNQTYEENGTFVDFVQLMTKFQNLETDSHFRKKFHELAYTTPRITVILIQFFFKENVRDPVEPYRVPKIFRLRFIVCYDNTSYTRKISD